MLTEHYSHRQGNQATPTGWRQHSGSSLKGPRKAGCWSSHVASPGSREGTTPPTVSRLFSYRGDQTQSSVQPQGLELIFQTSEKHQEKKKNQYKNASGQSYRSFVLSSVSSKLVIQFYLKLHLVFRLLLLLVCLFKCRRGKKLKKTFPLSLWSVFLRRGSHPPGNSISCPIQ